MQESNRFVRWICFLPYLWGAVRRAYNDYRQVAFPNDGVVLGNNVQFLDTPIIDVGNGGRLEIGEDVMIDSDRRAYHSSMHSPTKLVAKTPGAIILIGSKSRIHGTCIHARSSVRIGRQCLIAANCHIVDSNGHEKLLDHPAGRLDSIDQPLPIVIGDSVWIGMNCVILPGVSIGDGAVIGTGSVVTRDIPAGCFAAGVPAEVLERT